MQNVPPEYQGRIGNVTAEKTIPELRKFVEGGGTIIAIGSSTSIAYHFGLPIEDHLVEKLPNGEVRRLGSEKYYLPGSVLRAAVDNTNPVAWGFGDHVDLIFSNSPVFRLGPEAVFQGVKPIMWFDTDSPLRSGWAWGQSYLLNGVAAIDAPVGKGRVYLFGPEITFRAQPHGTFKFLFNGIYAGGATTVNLGGRKTS